MFSIRHLRRVVILLFVSLMVQPLAAQEDVDALAAEMDALISGLMTEHAIPGAAAAVFAGDEVVWANGYGAADVESARPATADTLFPVWSIAKAFTAAAVLREVEDHGFDLDAPIMNEITTWAFPPSRHSADRVTARRILSHTAGLSAEGYAALLPDDPVPTLPDLLSGNGGDRLTILFTPGQRFMYSGGGYTLLQLALEERSGQPFAEWIDSTLLEPLGLENTSFAYQADRDRATSYLRDGEADPRVVHVAQAAGGLYTSAADLARFLAALNSGMVVSPERAAEMFTPAEMTGDNYGLGVYVGDADGTAYVWHDGIGFGARSIFLFVPEAETGIVILTNSANGEALYPEVLCAFQAWAALDMPTLCDWH